MGFTLVEVMFALVILASAVLGLGVFAGRQAHTLAESRSRSTAGTLVVEQLEKIKGVQQYAQVDGVYAGMIENPVPGHAGYVRTTYVTRVQVVPPNPSPIDYKLVTVSVTAPGLAGTVKKTTAIAAF
ncbi:MAG: hypothetical protein PVSMB8_17170 [Vulcanimicrobiaceae bacterium]